MATRAKPLYATRHARAGLAGWSWLVPLVWLAGGACVAGLAGLIGWPGWLVYLAGPLAWLCWQGLAGLANDWPYLAWPRWLVLLGWLVGQAGRPG